MEQLSQISQEIANKYAPIIKRLIGDNDKKAIDIYYKLRKENLIPSLKMILNSNEDFDLSEQLHRQSYLMGYFCIAFKHYYKYNPSKLREIIENE